MIRTLLTACLCLPLLSMAACVGYDTWPSGRGELARRSPNVAPMDEIMFTSFRWMIEKYPPEGHTGPVAVNIPEGINERMYNRVADKADALPYSPETADLPVYHIREVRVRGSRAEVDALRPATELGPAPDGSHVYQGFTLYLDGGLGPWRVTRWQEWSIGTLQPPPYNPIRVPEQAVAGVEDEG